MKIEKVIAFMQEVAADKMNMEIDVPILVNSRLTRTLGRVTHQRVNYAYKPIKIEFSKQFLETSTDESVYQVALHELAHYIATRRSGENEGHNAHFKIICAEIGCYEDKTQTKVERTTEVVAKYDILCSCCGKKIGERSRACKITKDQTGYTSKCCSAKVTVIQNF